MENQLGARIAKLRRACGLTQETLGGQLGVSAAAVSKWETGRGLPGCDAVVSAGQSAAYECQRAAGV